MQYQYKESLGNLTIRVSRALGKQLNQIFRNNGLEFNSEHWILLAALYEGDGLTQKQLVELSDRDKTNVTRLLAFLEEQGMVRRYSNQHDRRKKEVYLTDKANTMKPLLQDLAAQTLEEALKGIAAEDMETCKEVLKGVCLNLDKKFEVNTEI